MLLGCDMSAAAEHHVLKHVRKALPIRPLIARPDVIEHAHVHHLAGVSLSLLGRQQDALGEFGRALELNPRYLEALIHQGLVLICGPSGSGKSTTLAALVNLFNEKHTDHVVTMEDPIEFVHPFKNCLINQREIGSHTASYGRALRAALREDPDVIVIGELRDNESITLALSAAETGHVVLGTLNSTSAAKAVDRIISSFPADEQPRIRASLSESVKYVIFLVVSRPCFWRPGMSMTQPFAMIMMP